MSTISGTVAGGPEELDRDAPETGHAVSPGAGSAVGRAVSPGAVLAVLAIGLVLVARQFWYPTLADDTIWARGALITLVPLAVWAVAPLPRRGLLPERLLAAGLLFVPLWFGGVWIFHLVNAVGDHGPLSNGHYQVVEHWHGRDDRGLMLQSADLPETSLVLPEEKWRHIENGATIYVAVRPGRLGIPWIITYSLTPDGPDVRHSL